MDLKVGDVVKLKTGGPKMTVERLYVNSFDDSKMVGAVWFDASEYEDGTVEYGQLHRDDFVAALLEKTNP